MSDVGDKFQIFFHNSFVEFELPEDAAAAIDNMNDSELYGRTIRVNFGTF